MWYLIILLKVSTAYLAYPEGTSLPATEYDTVFTCMINFQDTLVQTRQEYGSLWCDEGVYSIAKELQLLLPQ